MIPGNPPHHSKVDDEPVTIDLEANEADRHEAAVEQRDDETGSSSVNEVEVPLDTVAETPPETPASAPPEPPHPSAQPDITDAHSGRGATTLVAAGIVGGLIALVCAGAAQYGGLLPGISAVKTNDREVAALNTEIDGLKQAVGRLSAAPGPDASLEARIAALETTVKNAPATASGDASAPAVDPASAQKIAALTAEVDQLKTDVTRTTQSQASVGADLNKRLDDAEKKLSEPGKDVAVAQAIAAAGLKAAIDRGGAFRPELDTFAGVSPNDPAVALLKNYADTGVPSRAELIRQVPDIATAIISASQQPDQNQSWSDRLMSSAKSLVTVRPVGDVQGDSVDAIAARFENMIRNGDLPGAVTEWNSLPEAGKTASAAFKQSIEARIKVEDLVGETLSKAIAGAGKQS